MMMMKSTILHGLILAICLGSATQLRAQDKVQVENSSQAFGQATVDYRIQRQDIGEVEGSPYLTEEFMEGKVLMNRVLYTDLDLRYNVYSDRFEVRLDQGIIQMDPVRTPVDTLYYFDHRFVRKFLQPAGNKNLVHLAVLCETGGSGLYKRYRVVLTPAKDAEAYKAAQPARLSPAKPEYYLGDAQGLMPCKGVKSLAEFFGIDTREVKSFLKQEGLKAGTEEGLVAACAHFARQ
jgi:hypothetical protein